MTLNAALPNIGTHAFFAPTARRDSKGSGGGHRELAAPSHSGKLTEQNVAGIQIPQLPTPVASGTVTHAP
jgi:hypothetical protein